MVSGERLNGIQEVSGSIPLISTNPEQNEHSYLGTERSRIRFVMSDARVFRLSKKSLAEESAGDFCYYRL